MKDKLFFSLSIAIAIVFGFGMLMGYIVTDRFKSCPEVKEVEVEKLVSPCDKAVANAEKQMCIAREVCNGKLKNFNHDSLRTKTTFDCRE